ncbi:MAG: hypothetical protein NC223_03920 [Butyrivibrio sp.]|nr:hypothetical protein [Butyrivibrio sp.]
MERILELVRQLNIYADRLIEVRRSLINHKENLNASWDAYEVNAVNDAIDSVNAELIFVRAELEGIGRDLIAGQSELEESDDL